MWGIKVVRAGAACVYFSLFIIAFCNLDMQLIEKLALLGIQLCIEEKRLIMELREVRELLNGVNHAQGCCFINLIMLPNKFI